MRESDAEELDILIDGFLNSELSDLQREALAARIESDPAAAHAFDESLRTEALLRAAHTDRKLPIKGAAVRSRPHAAARKTPVRAQFAPGAWIAVAAMLTMMFGAAFYYKATAPSTTEGAVRKSDKVGNTTVVGKDGQVSAPVEVAKVVSGRVWVDGRDARTILENEWLNVSPDGPAELKCGERIEIELDTGSGALLRRNGTTLLNGSGTFHVKAGADAFTLETNAGNVILNQGEFAAKLEPVIPAKHIGGTTMKRSMIALAVTVLAGTVQVEFNGARTRMTIGDNRVFGAEGQVADNDPRPQHPRGDGDRRPPPPPPPPPSPFGLVGMILDHGEQLKLTPDQVKQLEAIKVEVTERRAIFDNDKALQELRRKHKEARDNDDHDAARKLRDQIHTREDELRKDFTPGTNPRSVLTEDQNKLLREIMEKNRPQRPHGPDGQRPPHGDGPPPPRPEGGPPHPEGDRPPRPEGDRPPRPEGDGPPPPRGDRPPPRDGKGPPPPPHDGGDEEGRPRPPRPEGGDRRGPPPPRPGGERRPPPPRGEPKKAPDTETKTF